MSYLSPYPGGCSPADIDDAYGDDEKELTCPCCGWQGCEDDLVGHPVILPGRSNTLVPSCPDCSEAMVEVY